MTKNQMNERNQLEMLTIEQLVPENHLVRKLDATLTFRLYIHQLKIYIQKKSVVLWISRVMKVETLIVAARLRQ